MASLFRPRNLILVTLSLCGGLFYFYSSRQLLNAARSSYHSQKDPGLPSRLAKGEEIYRRMLKGREDLLEKFGPSPKDVVMYVCCLFSYFSTGMKLSELFITGFHQIRIHGQPIQPVSVPILPASFNSTDSHRFVEGDFFPPAFNCPHELERIGNLGDGGKWVCGLSRIEDKPDCVIYSFGSLHFSLVCPHRSTTALPHGNSRCIR